MGASLLAAFPGYDVAYGDGETVFSGTLDQAALFGALAQIEALGLELLEVRRVGPSMGADQPDRPATTHPDQREDPR